MSCIAAFRPESGDVYSWSCLSDVFPPMLNLLVFTKKSVFMQRIADAVRQGYHWHVSGQVTVEKADYLADKFDRVFRISRTPVQAFRARQQGEATARLLLWMPEEDAEKLVWILLKTDGKEYLPGHRPEPWRHAMEDDQRISLTGYWLVRMTKPGYPQPVWTWRYMPERQAEIRAERLRVIPAPMSPSTYWERLSAVKGRTKSNHQLP